jgi:spermidine synthase
MNFPARAFSLLAGLLSLSSETLWVRTFSFAQQSTPLSVSFVLAVYLVAIAFGAAVGAWVCKGRTRLPEVAIVSMAIAAIIIALSPLLLEWRPFSRRAAALLMFGPAFFLSICFPICHELGTVRKAGKMGRSMSTVYAANIVGSTLGPLLVNFGLLQVATTQLAFAVLGTIGIGISALFALYRSSSKPLRLAAYASVVLAVACTVRAAGPENLLMTKLSRPPHEIRRIIETRQGVVASYKSDPGGDPIYGGNVYDGRANIDVRINSNGIHRVLVLAAARPAPKRVLVIGLSVGSWTYLLSGFPSIEHMDAVEINPGYFDLIRDYEDHRRILNDPKISFHVGDGRRFLRRSAGKYDLMVMNTTWHWRSYSTFLLSKEFLELARDHLAPDGLIAYNSTESPDALKTATAVFPHAYLYDNFVVAAGYDWRQKLTEADAVEHLMSIAPQGRPVFLPADRELANSFLSTITQDLDTVASKANRPLEVITDRNMITEYRFGRPW